MTGTKLVLILSLAAMTLLLVRCNRIRQYERRKSELLTRAIEMRNRERDPWTP